MTSKFLWFQKKKNQQQQQLYNNNFTTTTKQNKKGEMQKSDVVKISWDKNIFKQPDSTTDWVMCLVLGCKTREGAKDPGNNLLPTLNTNQRTNDDQR